ncbi:MAG: NfeD-like family protein 1 [Pusillimonas sp.]|jgi:membrane protein implicated in regulation of membrane protease activity|nr:NfeD-like family protein 1 [Pusillimonas sp.]
MWFWFGIAALALIGEILSGTFYLLLIAVGFVAAGVAAVLGAGLATQIAVVALVTGLGLIVLRKTRFLKKREINAARNRDVLMDIGQTVVVTTWAEGNRTKIRYRGASWDARLAKGAVPKSGPHKIIEMDGTVLVLEPEEK